MLSLSEGLLFVWETDLSPDLVMSGQASTFQNRGEKILVKDLLWWVRKFWFQRKVVLWGGLIF